MSALWELFVRISADNSSFKSSMKDSANELAVFEKVAANAGAKLASTFGFAALATEAIHLGEQFEAAGFKIQRSTGATGASLESLEGSLQTLYAHSSQSAEGIAGALSQLTIRTGLQGAALESLAASTLQFAKVTGLDLQTSVQENQRLFQQWQVATTDQSLALDELFAASQKTGVATSLLVQSMMAVGPALRGFGFSFTETLALVSQFSKVGLDASDVMGALRFGLLKIAESGRDPKQALFDLVEQMQHAATAADALHIAAETFGKRGAVALQDAVRRGAFATKELQVQLEDAKGLVDRTAESTKSLSDRWLELWHTISIPLGGAGKELLSWLADVLGKVAQWAEAEKAVNTQIKLRAGATSEGGSAATLQVANGYYGPATGVTSRSNSLNTPLPGGGGGSGTGGKLDKFNPFLQVSDSIAVLIAREKDAQSAHAKTIDDIAKSGLTIQMYWTEKMGEANKGMADFNASIPPVVDDLGSMDKALDGSSKFVESLQKSILDAKQEAADTSPWGQLTEAMHYLGVNSSHDLELIAENAQEAYAQVKGSGVASADDITRAWLKMQRAVLEADYAMGDVDQELYEQRKANLDAAEKAESGSIERIKRDRYDLGRELEQQAHRTFDQIERGLASDIVHWKGWSDTLKDIATTTATDMLSIMLKGFLKPLEDQFAKVAAKIGGWMSGLIGGGGGASQTALQTGGGYVGAIGSGGAGAAGAAGSVASAGVMGTVGAIGSAVSAVSGVIGNFQMAGMNKSLDLIEKSCRYSEIYLGGNGYESIFGFTKQTWQTLVDIKGYLWSVQAEYLRQINDTVTWGKGGGGGKGGLTFNNCTFTGSPDQIANSIFNQAALAGAL